MLRLVHSQSYISPPGERLALLGLLKSRAESLNAPDTRPLQAYEVWCAGDRITMRTAGTPVTQGILVHSFQAHTWEEAKELMQLALRHSHVDYSPR